MFGAPDSTQIRRAPHAVGARSVPTRRDAAEPGGLIEQDEEADVKDVYDAE